MTRSEIGHLQHFTPFEKDDDAAFGKLTFRTIPKKSKAIDMKFFCLRKRENQKQFKLYCFKEIDNLNNYFTKHYTPL